MPDKIGKAFFLNKENFLYSGNANATVAGARKKEIICRIIPNKYATKIIINCFKCFKKSPLLQENYWYDDILV